MRTLATHYTTVRRAHPTDDVAIVFDIDGTIVDPRSLAVHVLLAYDRDRGTDIFHGLVADDITVPETRVGAMLDRLHVPTDRRDDVADFYLDHLWDEGGVLAASAPYRGVLGVIRWFQIQAVHIALNAGGPESMRRITLDSLNAVGRAARVRFDPELLFMRADRMSVADAKVDALQRSGRKGSASWRSWTTSPRTSTR